MVLKVEATFENGVFVPVERPAIADHERVRLIVETVSPQMKSGETAHRCRTQRIQLDPALAREIASSAEFNPDGN